MQTSLQQSYFIKRKFTKQLIQKGRKAVRRILLLQIQQ